MSFNSEENLRDVALPKIPIELKSVFTALSLKYFLEAPYPAGITDAVYYNISKRWLENRIYNLSLTNGMLNDNHLKLYLFIRSKRTWKVSDLAKVTNTNNNTLVKNLTWLRKNGYIKYKNGLVNLKEPFRKHVTNTCAFEFKLKDWKRALRQAFGAKSYSHMQFVVIDDDYINSAIKNKNIFKKYNIGLLSINPDSKLKKHYIPSNKDTPYSDFSIWKFNEISLSYLNTHRRTRC